MKKFLSKLFGGGNTESSVPQSEGDYSHVTTREQAIELCEQGKLFKVLMLPEEFGGEDIPANILYVPRGAVEARELVLETLLRFAREGLFNEINVKPDYKGDSFVPSKINFLVSHSEKETGNFKPSIEVW